MPTMTERRSSARLTTPSTTEQVHTGQQILSARVLLLAPSFSFWRGYYQLPKGELSVSIAGTKIDNDSVTTNRAVLLSDKHPVDANEVAWKKRFQKIESRGRAMIERFSVPFPIHGVRIVPKSAGEDFFRLLFGPTIGSLRRRVARADERGDFPAKNRAERLLREALEANPHAGPNTPVFDPELASDEQSVAYALHLAANEFCATLPNVLAQIQANLDKTVWEAVSSKIPMDPYKMREKFHMDVTPVELAGGAVDRVTADDLSEHNQLVREACQRRVNEAVEEMVRGPRAELAEALASLQGLIKDDGRVTARSFAPVRAAIAKIRMFDFVADNEILATIGDLERRLDITAPAQLNSTTAAQNGFSAALATWQSEVESAESAEATIERFGRPLRDIDI